MPDIQKAYNWAIQTCNAPNIGYSMAYRNQQTVNGVTRYDCSSFVFYALKNGGFTNQANADGFYTFTMIPIIQQWGFQEVSITGEWKAGDIVWRNGHTEMVYEGGMGQGRTMGAHQDDIPLDEQVSIRDFWTSNYTRIFRYGNGADYGGGYGASEYVVAAICGNWKREGIMNPGQWEFGKPMAPPWDAIYPAVGGHGLGGWTNSDPTDGMNLLNLHNYLIEHGYDDNSGAGQLDCFIDIPWWNPISVATNFSSLDDFLKSQSTDLEMLTHAFYNGWEGLQDGWADGALELRQEYARWALDIIRTRANDTSIVEWKVLVTNSSALSIEDQANNVIMVYRYLSSGGGGGGTHTDPKRNKMKIWQMINYWY